MSLPWIYLKSECQGLFSINGNLVGEGNFATAPATLNAQLYISFEPTAHKKNNYVFPITRKITIKQDEVVLGEADGSLKICIWENSIVEIEIFPPLMPMMLSEGFNSKTWDGIEFNLGSQLLYAYVFNDSQNYLIVENIRNKQVVFLSPLTEFGDIESISIKKIGELSYLCVQGSDIVGIYSVTPKFSEIICTRCISHEITNSGVHIVHTNPNFKGLQDIYIYSPEENKLVLKEKKYAHEGEYAQVVEFLSKVSNNDEQAMDYFSASLAREFSFDEIYDFFENFNDITTPIKQSSNGLLKLGLCYAQEKYISRAKIFAFEMSDDKIYNITEVDP